MRKIFTFLTTLLIATAANAQKITFGESDVRSAAVDESTGVSWFHQKTYEVDGFAITITDNATNKDGANPKFAIDANSSKFGTADSYDGYTHRLKPGVKSSDNNKITLTLPSDGELKICARTGKAADTDRNLVITQDGVELVNKVLLDGDAVKNEEGQNVFPIVSTAVKAGEAVITYPTNSVNFYAFELIPASAEPKSFDAKTETYPHKNWLTEAIELPIEEIAEALGYADVDALIAAFNESQIVWGVLPDGTETNESTSDPQGFWMDADGKVSAFAGALWYAFVSVDEGKMFVNIGMMPDTAEEGADYKTVLTLKNGEKSYIINVEEVINQKPDMDIVTELSKLNIVKEYTGTLDFVYGKNNVTSSTNVDVTGIAEALEISEEDLSASFVDRLYAQVVNNVAGEGEDDKFEEEDQLYPIIAKTDGWFGRYIEWDEEAAKELPLEHNYLHNWGAGCTYYLHGNAYADGVYSIGTYGQYGGTMKAGDEETAILYVINGDKAAKITLTSNVVLPEAIPFDEMTQVGELTVTPSAKPQSGYDAINTTIDMAAVLEQLDCTAAEVKVMYFAEEGVVTEDGTANNGGSWFDDNGYVISHGNGASFYMEPTSFSDGNWNIGQYPNHFADITEDKVMTTDIIMSYLDKYVTVHVNYTVKVPEEVDEDFYKEVGSDVLNIQIIPSAEAYMAENKTQLDYDYISSLIGETFVLYGEKYRAATEEKEEEIYMDPGTNCSDGDAKGAGFWYKKTTHENKDGETVVTADGWGENSFGFQLSASGEISWFQIPGERSVGDEYFANIWFVNEETGDYYKYALNVKFVSELSPETEEAGSEEIGTDITTLEDDHGLYVLPLDLAKAMEALEIPEGDTDILSAATVLAGKSPSVFEEYAFDDSEIMFGTNGFVIPESQQADYEGDFIMVSFGFDGDEPIAKIDDSTGFLENNPEEIIPVHVGFEYNGKRYLYTINMAASGVATGVTKIDNAAVKANGKYIENKRVVIVRNGQKYNVAGAVIK